MPNEWGAVGALPALETGKLQLWRISLADAAAGPEVYGRHLSPAELARAERLRAGQVRMQFVVGRACLRTLLGNLLHLRPSEVPIHLSAYGKPETPVKGDPLFFNIAHSRETVLIALCRSSSVGVDLEYLDRTTEVLEIARSSFTANELRQIEQVSNPAERRRAFFRAWTRKEAVIKADGRGLSLPLTAFEVPVSGRAVSARVVVEEGPGRPQIERPWFVSDIEPCDETAGAFAAAVPGLKLETFEFAPGLLDTAKSVL